MFMIRILSTFIHPVPFFKPTGSDPIYYRTFPARQKAHPIIPQRQVILLRRLKCERL
jgi:hypothetical protein